MNRDSASGEGRAYTGSGERNGGRDKADPDRRAAVGGPTVSGDAANVGTRLGGEGTRGAGGATSRGNPGDAGADAGDGAIDATDATVVTGDEATIAGDEEDRGRLGARRKAPGALGPEDLDTSDVDMGPSVVGPAADERGDVAAPMGTGTGTRPEPRGVGVTNVRGPRDQERERESPAPRAGDDAAAGPGRADPGSKSSGAR